MASAISRKRGRSDLGNPNFDSDDVFASEQPARVLSAATLETALQSAKCATLPDTSDTDLDTKDTESRIAGTVAQKPKTEDVKSLTCEIEAQKIHHTDESEVLKSAQQERNHNVVLSNDQAAVSEQGSNASDGLHNKIIGPARDWPDRKKQVTFRLFRVSISHHLTLTWALQ